MSFIGMASIADSYSVDGSYHYSTFSKLSIPSTATTDVWLDLSVSSGVPKYNAYVGSQYEATQMFGVGNDGIYSGPEPETGKDKRLLTWGAVVPSPAVPVQLTLCDYLMFYPLIDLDSSDEQIMTNTVNLPRYSDGYGVRMMITCSVQAVGAGDYTIVYENHLGEEKSVTQRLQASSTGWLMTSADNAGATTGKTPFVKLASGDLGVRRVKSITAQTIVGGFANVVLVKPLAQLSVYENGTYSEMTLVNDKITFPKIENGAYLNLLAHIQNIGTISIRSDFLFITR